MMDRCFNCWIPMGFGTVYYSGWLRFALCLRCCTRWEEQKRELTTTPMSRGGVVLPPNPNYRKPDLVEQLCEQPPYPAGEGAQWSLKHNWDVDIPEDPRELLKTYIREGVILKDIGPRVIEQRPELGVRFITEVRTVTGQEQIVLVDPRDAIGRTPEQFLLVRLRAIVHCIREMLRSEETKT